MKKTKYWFMVSSSVWKGEFRRVWADENGNFFVRNNGKIWNVTDKRENFVEE